MFELYSDAIHGIQYTLIINYPLEDVDQTYRPRVTALFRAAQTPLGEVGEDMIEQEKRTYYHLNQPSSKHYAFTANQQRPVKEVLLTLNTKHL